ncbi:MAG TPA: hydroxyphenylacetyl-CoA thioesterase PaaI [Beijerinckiaceae bacterium]|nr:hydroxyphenylacetyl-CoA thioesterase PaaI [Beijerinckiaceae bacterium]
MTANELARACADAMWAEDKASRTLGMALGAVSAGRAVLTMPVTETMVNGHGICHGGYIFTLADSAFAFACNTYNARTVAQSCAITYIAAARLGDVLTATGTEVSRTGRSGIYDIAVQNQAGATIAVFRGNSRTIKGEFFPGVIIVS